MDFGPVQQVVAKLAGLIWFDYLELNSISLRAFTASSTFRSEILALHLIKPMSGKQNTKQNHVLSGTNLT